MKKNGLILLMLALVAVMVGGYLAYSQPNKGNPITPPKTAKLKPKSDKTQIKDEQTEEELSQSNTKGNNLPNNNGPIRNETPQTKKTAIPPVDSDKGERFVEGEIKAVDRERQIITIEQMMDDLSQQVNPEVHLADNAVIQTEKGNITLAQVRAGDLAGIILNQNGQARAVKVIPKE